MFKRFHSDGMTEREQMELALQLSQIDSAPTSPKSVNPTHSNGAVPDDISEEDLAALIAQVEKAEEGDASFIDMQAIAAAENLPEKYRHLTDNAELIIAELSVGDQPREFGETADELTTQVPHFFKDGRMITVDNTCPIKAVFRASSHLDIDIMGYCLALLYMMCVNAKVVTPGRMTSTPAFQYMAKEMNITIYVLESDGSQWAYTPDGSILQHVEETYRLDDPRRIRIKNVGRHYVPM